LRRKLGLTVRDQKKQRGGRLTIKKEKKKKSIKRKGRDGEISR